MEILIEETKKEKINIEQKIIIGLITDSNFISEYINTFSQIKFGDKAINWICERAISYYINFKESINYHIQDLFLDEKNEMDSSLAKSISLILSNLSTQFESEKKLNSKYLLKKTEKYFRTKKLFELTNDIEKFIKIGKIEKAENIIKTYYRPAIEKTKGINPFKDKNIAKKILEKDEGQILFEIKGILGKQLGPLKRGWLMAVLANTGIGKTWWLIYIAKTAIMNGCNVLFVSYEMSEEEVAKRLYHMLSGKTTNDTGEIIKIPSFDCERNYKNACNRVDRSCRVKFDDDDYLPCKACIDKEWYIEKITYKEMKPKIMQEKDIFRIQKKMAAIKRIGELKIVQFSSKRTTTSDLEAYIKNLEVYENFNADVIITDYADKIKGFGEQERDKIASVWEWHKGFAQEKNVFCITASQSNTARKGGDAGSGTWADSIKKEDLIDVGFAVNQKSSEYDEGVYRIQVVKQRHKRIKKSSQIKIISCLDIGNVYIDSIFYKKNVLEIN